MQQGLQATNCAAHVQHHCVIPQAIVESKRAAAPLYVEYRYTCYWTQTLALSNIFMAFENFERGLEKTKTVCAARLHQICVTHIYSRLQQYRLCLHVACKDRMTIVQTNEANIRGNTISMHAVADKLSTPAGGDTVSSAT